jgi:hypothetical protein
VKLTVAVDSTDDSADLGDLRGWISSDDRLRRAVSASTVMAESTPEEMGGGQIVEFVITTGISLGSLLVSIASWRQSRPHQPTVLLSRDRGPVVTLSSSSETAVREITVKLGGDADTDDPAA